MPDRPKTVPTPTPAPNGKDMVHWYAPLALAGIGLRAAAALVVGGLADNRETQEQGDPISKAKLSGIADYRTGNGNKDFWFDFTADVGDGFDPAYAVARCLAQDKLQVEDETLPRGRFLIIGGDLVYPNPSTQNYEDRFVVPLREASRGIAEGDVDNSDSVVPFADLYAIPGNHDWYDGLQAFMNLISAARFDRAKEADKKGQVIGGWQTRQRRSYFMLRLPGDWWVIGADDQFGNYLDRAQTEYFSLMADRHLKAGQKIILCTATPSWVLSNHYKKPRMMANLRTLHDLLTKNGAEIDLLISGDQHHYLRYDGVENYNQPTLITAGGGGAFMHPTHPTPETLALDMNDDGKPDHYRRVTTYPSTTLSRQISARNLLLPFINLEFAAAVGLIYAFLAWFLQTRSITADIGLSDAFLAILGHNANMADALREILGKFVRTLFVSPEFFDVFAAVWGALASFSQGSTGLKIFAGFCHSLAHVIGLLLAFCFSVQLSSSILSNLGIDITTGYWLPALASLLMVTLGGIIGGTIFGTYLFAAVNLLHHQWTNSFSSLRIKDYKNFLRLKINAKGELFVYAMKIARVPRIFGTNRPWPEPEPELIEKIGPVN